MKKQLLVVAFALFLGIFAQPQSLFAYYPCEFKYPGQTGNCEGCGDFLPTDCHRDCTETLYGYNCSQVNKVIPVCALNTTYYNNSSCSCPVNTTQNFLYGGIGSFSCTPICQMNVIYSYSRNYSDRCGCPVNTTTLGVSTTNSPQLDSFKCVQYNYQPQPSPAPVIMQTCWNGTIIPNTSSCPSKPVQPSCSYNQYWSGYSCVDYYQQYIPVVQPIIQFPSVYDWQYYNQQDYFYNWFDTNNWSNGDWVYF